jgi:tetratricopeptide (TPR) repeat protein
MSLLAVVGTGAYVVHRAELKRNAHVFLDRADHNVEEGDLAGAVDYYARYLQLAPADVAAWEKYARVLERRAESGGGSANAYLKAFLAYEEVLRRDDGRVEVRRQAARLALRLGRLADARTHLEALATALPKDAVVKRLLGECDEAAGDFQTAAAHYKAATLCDLHDLLSYAKLAYVQREHLSDPKAADRAMNNLVNNNRRSAAAYVTRAVYCMRQSGTKALEQAARDVEKARQLSAQDPDVILAAVTLAETKDDWAKAADLLHEGLGANRKMGRLYKELAAVQVHLTRPKDAADTLRRGVKAVPQDHDLRWELANLETELGDWQAAAEELAHLREVESPAPPLDYLDARVLILRGEWRAAAAKLERTRGLLAEQPRWGRLAVQADFWLGRCYEQLGNTDQEYVAYRRAVSADPLWQPACLGLARVLSSMGRVDDALAEYRKVLPRAPEVRLEVARLMIVRNVERGAENADWEGVEQLLGEVARDRFKTPELALTWADLLAARGDAKEADRLLEAAARKHTTHAGLWVARAVLAERAGHWDRALALLDDAGRHLKDPIEVRLARVYYWGARKAPDAGRGLANALRGVAKYGAAGQARVLSAAAAAYAEIAQSEEARRLWVGLAEREPNNLTYRAKLFELLLDASDLAGADEVLGHIERIDGSGGSVYGTARAALLIARGLQGDRSGLDEAADLLGAVGRRRPAWSQVSLLQARLDELNGNTESAIDHYRQALARGERDPAVVRRAAQLLHDRRRFPEAEQILAKIRRQGARHADLDRLAADIALDRGDYAAALRLAEQAVTKDSRNYRDWLWLGQVRRAAGHMHSAEQALRRAVSLAGDKPEPWVVLVQFYAGTGQREQAEALIPKAADRIAKDQAALALAHCYQVLGQREEAARRYREAVAQHPDDGVTLRNVAMFFLGTGHRQEAEPLLRKMTGLGGKAAGEAAWARRALAVVLGSDGDPQRMQQALALLGLGDGARRAPGTSDLEDQRAQAIVLSMKKDSGQRRQAAAILEGLAGREAAQPDDLFLLTQLYERLGEPVKAQTTMLRVLALEPDNPGYLRHHIQRLFADGLARDTEPWLARLEKHQPGEWQVVEFKARALRADHREAEAIDLIKAEAARRAGRAGMAASLLEEFGDDAGAQAHYRQYVAASRRPESVLVLAGFLGRHHKVEQALDLCDQAWERCEPEAVALHALGILQAPDVTAAHTARVARHLEAAVRAHADKVALRRYLADLRVLQGRYAEAETLYRQVLAKDPRALTALNNLAWLLSAKQHRHDEALRLLDRAVREAGEQPELLDTRAVVYLALDEPGLARKDLEQAIQEAPTPAMYFHLAQAQWRSKRRPEAITALSKAKSLGLTAALLGAEDGAVYRRLVAELGIE